MHWYSQAKNLKIFVVEQAWYLTNATSDPFQPGAMPMPQEGKSFPKNKR
jgi:hypothetical protein